MNSSDEVVSPAAVSEPPSPSGGELTAAPAPSSLFDQRRPLATPVLLIANLTWFAVGIVIARRLGVPIGSYLWFGNHLVIERLGAVSAAGLWNGDWWRLLTCCFVHVGFWHLLMNMVGLVMVGPAAEWLWGRWRVFAIYLLAGLGGACAAMALRPVDPEHGLPVIVAGASGAFWGMMGSLVAWLLLFHRRLNRADARYFASRLGFALLLNIGVSLLPGVSWEGHAGGGVVGFVAALLLSAVRRGRRRRVLALLVLAGIPVACVGALIWAMRSAESWAPVRNRMMVKETVAFAHRQPARILAHEFATGAYLGIEGAVRAWMADQQLLALFNAVSPSATGPLEIQSVLLLSREPELRRSEDVAELRKKLEAVLKATEVLKQRLAGPTGNTELDTRRAKAHAFLDARERSIKLLLEMLDSKALLDKEARKMLGQARSETSSLWKELNEPAPKK